VYTVSNIQDDGPQPVPHSIILVNSNILTDSYKQIHTETKLVTAISILTAWGPLDLYNIYNSPGMDSALVALGTWLAEHPPTTALLWLGNFNIHHPLWSGPAYPGQCQHSNTTLLIALLAYHNMECWLPVATPTYQLDIHHTWSTIDLICCSPEILPLLTSCNASPVACLHGADYLPIQTVVNTSVPCCSQTPKPNFHNTDLAKFHGTLVGQLQTPLQNVNQVPDCLSGLDTYITHLTNAIQVAISDAVPLTKPIPFTK